MHDKTLNPEGLSQSASQIDMERLDQRIVRVLEAAPQLRIPADFAARVANQLPASRPVSLTPTHYGRYAMLIGTVVTLAALVILALHSTRPTFGLLESLLFAQFIALAVWLTVWRYGLR
jgi:uncharacterized membrane protein